MTANILYLDRNVPESRFTGLPAVLHQTYVDACKKTNIHTKHQILGVEDSELLKLNDKY